MNKHVLRLVATSWCSALLLTACPSDDSSTSVADASSGGNDSTTGEPNTSSNPDSTGPADTTAGPGSTGGTTAAETTAAETTAAETTAAETTAAETTAAESTTTAGMESTTTAGMESTGSTGGTTGAASEGSTGGTTGGPADTGFGECFGDFACDGEEICFNVNSPGTADQGTVCGLEGCAVAADCPAQPGGGNAPTQCFDANQDAINDCLITCDGGETCPDGMTCSLGFVCVWPTAWTCDLNYYADADCDCGCGVADPACADGTVASCGYCDDAGSCSTEVGCPGSIDPVDNSTCASPSQCTEDPGSCDAPFDDCACVGCNTDGFCGIDDDCTCPDCSGVCGCLDDGTCDVYNEDCACADCSDTPACAGGSADTEVLTAGPGLGTAIPDNTYTGALGSMGCVTLPLASDGSDTVASVTLDLAVTHTWIGDLTIKVVSPSNTVVTVMSRPGVLETADDGNDTAGSGDSTNLASTSPVHFENGLATSAENMGAAPLGTNDVVCQTDGICDFAPNPGAAVAGDFSAFVGQSGVGNWQLCIGDSAGLDTGTIDTVTLTVGTN